MMCCRLLLSLLVIFVANIASENDCAKAQDGVVLRNLEIVPASVDSFDRDRVVLFDGTILGWDQIHQAVVAPDRQNAFDRMLVEIGLPLFQVRHRLKMSDWESLGEAVEPLYSTMKSRQTTKESARADYLICIATMLGRLNVGNRVAAVEPFLVACSIRSGGFEFTNVVPQVSDLSPKEVETRLSNELLPIFYDVATARRQLSNADFRGSNRNELGTLTYSSAMLICSGELERALRHIELLEQHHPKTHWAVVLRAQLEIATETGRPIPRTTGQVEDLRKSIRTATMSREERIVAKFVLAKAMMNDPRDQPAAMLEFCQIAAICGQQYRFLSSAALFQALTIAKKLKRTTEYTILQHELVEDYSATFHGRLVTSSNPSKTENK